MEKSIDHLEKYIAYNAEKHISRICFIKQSTPAIFLHILALFHIIQRFNQCISRNEMFSVHTLV